MNPQQFQIWSAKFKRDDSNVVDVRPALILGFQGQCIIVLKCTTNINTKIPHLGLNYKDAGLKEPTVIEFKKRYFLKKDKLVTFRGVLNNRDLLNVFSKLRISPLKDFYLEKLNESFSDKYDFATHYQRHVQQNALNKDNIKNQFNFMPPERYEKIAIELMNSPAGPSKSQEHDVVGFKVDQGRHLKFDKRYNTLIIYNPEEKEILTCYKINYNKYLSRLDRDFKGELPENEITDIESEDILTEAKKKKKKRKSQTQRNPVFKDVNDIMRWVAKRQKGLSPFSYLNPNAGNVEYNNDMFNHMTGADGGDFGSLSGSGNELGAPAGGIGGGVSAGGGGMGESLTLVEKNKHKSNHTQNNSLGELIWYKLPSGRMPAKEFYESSSIYLQSSFDILFENLSNNSLNTIKNSSKVLDSKEKIFELRVKDSEHWARITYTRLDGDSILLLGFNKDQNKTPQNEIEKYIKYKKNYIKNKSGEIFKL